MKYRNMKSDDINGVHEVEVSCFSDPWSLSAFKDELKNKLARYIVAENEDGKIVAYIGAWYILDEAHITNVAVHKDFRGQKIGDEMMCKFIEKCERDRLASITLEVRKSNIVAQNLYKKYGFLNGGLRKEYYGDNKEDALIMWKQLREVF
ncbi:ribosomal protein S18-alanine N-acetyltransferase [Peptostreptococcus equinus]|uniref:[Ribosomal protein bS18]-alanine N-acetyltransferase n=1 Tax=Peptostreptococcus equinus TaxID=3003601 RepID=A0ABY7JMR8_9FIRM|nr:ribosomal protein S18-alanine N-acetyltransferase [Peptostreptococcus sp. CBA3647]WAW14664.1 ribosomal protein S18-alanine N-acetyltransferase [Peptostreptococcus sp. CBA3647]